MSHLHLGTDQERLAEELDRNTRTAEIFQSTTVVAPNRYLAKWLRLWLARRRQVLANVHVEYLLEKALWDLLAKTDPRTAETPIEQLSSEDHHLLLLAALLDENAADATDCPVCAYLGQPGPKQGRDYCRRLWRLAGRMAGLHRDYEYHRQQVLVESWSAGKDGYPASGTAELRMERGQRALLNRAVGERGGLCARLGKATGRRYRTLAQYAAELQALPLLAAYTGTPVHFFCLTQLSALHIQILRWLGNCFDLHVYHLNPLLGQLDGLPASPRMAHTKLRQLAERFREERSQKAEADPELLAAWGRAGAESLWLVADLLHGKNPFQPHWLATPRPPAGSVLHRLQAELLHRPRQGKNEGPPPDCSLQMAPCPGIYREVETVYQSILHNLHQDDTLKQTDIAVLVTDMPHYRPVLQAVFDRPPRHIRYNLADYSAAELSPLGRAVMALLDLGLESFTRSRVFAVFLNPCVQARLGVDRDQVLAWLNWVQELGVFHAWDTSDRKAGGGTDSALFSWQLGLQRLRLGRLMGPAGATPDSPAPRFGHVLPFADLESGDKEQLGAFNWAVENLLPRLCRLRAMTAKAADWAAELGRLFDDFIAVPPDRPEEERVLVALRAALERFKNLDALRGGDAGLRLELVREFVQESLETLQASRGDFLTGGVTISALQPILPLPFRIVYVVGLGENHFGGSDVVTALDLRGRQRLPGDIRPAEMQRFLFLQAVLAARDKLYLLYNCKDLQKDEDLYPCAPLLELQRHQNIPVATVPLHAPDACFPDPCTAPTGINCVVNYSNADRLVALQQTERQGLQLTDAQMAAVKHRLAQQKRDFAIAAGPPTASAVTTIALTELSRFLRCPVEAGLRRHLHLRDAEETEASDDEPFYTVWPRDNRLLSDFLERFIAHALAATVDQALAEWRPRFAALYDERRLQCRAPDGAFADVDHNRLAAKLQKRIEGPEGLADFLRQRPAANWCGPVVMGESFRLVGARRRFPAPTLTLGAGAQVRLVGTLQHVWKTTSTVEVLLLTSAAGKHFRMDRLSRSLFEPLLFWFALQAEVDPAANGEGSQAWLGRRAFVVHLGHADGVTAYRYEHEDVTPAEAREYLTALAADFLDRASFDLLPFDLIAAHEKLRSAYDSVETSADPAQFARLLRDTVMDDEEEEYPKYRRPQLLEVVQATVPDDALNKVRRRFTLLNRGPARVQA